MNDTIPMKIKEMSDRYVVMAVFGKKLYIPKSQKDSSRMAETVRKALNMNRSIFYETDPDNPCKLIKVELTEKYDLSGRPCPDKREYSRDFWYKQHIIEKGMNVIVRWVAKSPDCGMYRVYFIDRAAVYFLHENHPRVREILDVAWKSINGDYEVIYYSYDNFITFICDMKLTGKKLE